MDTERKMDITFYAFLTLIATIAAAVLISY